MYSIEDIKNTISTIWFNPDGTYNLSEQYFYDYQIIIATEEEIEELKTLVTSFKAPIKDGDVILFKNSSFPKLFLKNIGSKITRTIKEEKATRIVTDSLNVINSEELKDIKECLLVVNSKNNYYRLYKENMKDQGIDLETFLKNNDFTIVENAKVASASITNKKIENCKHFKKLATTEQLVEYINNYLPSPTKEQRETLLSLLSSTEESNIELGINMIKMFNISDCIFDIYQALASRDRYNYNIPVARINRNNIRWKYLMSLGGMQMKDLRQFNQHRGTYALYNIYKLPFISLGQKQKCWLRAYLNMSWSRSDEDDKVDSYTEEYKKSLIDTTLTRFGFPSRYADVS